MKKTLILALVVTLMVTGSLFAQGRRLVAQPDATFAFGVGGAAAGPTTTNNDDSCDIGTAPAATLLLPYFAVARDRSRNTTFTIVNTVDRPQIAHVTVWTDWSFPVLDFNVFLTGYDVQPLSLHDIIFNAQIAPLPTGATGGTTTGGSTTSGTGLSPIGDLANQTNTNPNFAASIGCAGLPGAIPPNVAQAVQNALIDGTYVIPGTTASCGTNQVGSAASSATGSLHPANTAVGYVTIDVASLCSLRLPTDPVYFRSEILFDNVLTGDWQIFDSSPASNFAGGSPLVHIRAIPEGGPAGVALTPAQTNLPFTFYARYVNDATIAGVPIPRNFDRRQPLPHIFAARYIAGGAGAFDTQYRIWREGVTGGSGSALVTDCVTAVQNSALTMAEVVRFDEHENHTIYNISTGVSPATPSNVTLPEASSPGVNSGRFPPMPTLANDVGGWMYLNLNLSGTQVPSGGPDLALHPTYPAIRPSQNWVVISMSGSGASAGALAVDFDATWLGNGCSAPNPISVANQPGGVVIGPAGSGVNTTVGATLPGTLVCPAGSTCVPLSTNYPATNVTP
ncbi:MAG TPA: hypothetical protein VFL80_09710 [Thermoanaerobaculia bacterium]|nr:hypothetical protein [Thermoanaerobaculia bacterium]